MNKKDTYKNIQKVWVKNDTLFSKSILKGNTTRKHLPAGNNEFKLLGSDEVSLALINDPLDGEVIEGIRIAMMSGLDNDNSGGAGGMVPIVPIGASFTIAGIGGIRPFDIFNLSLLLNSTYN